MNRLKLLAAALAASLILASSGQALVAKASSSSSENPRVLEVVNPTNLPRKYIGTVVEVALTIDAEGRAHHVTVLSDSDRALVRSLEEAVAQWRFAPAQKDGTAVTQRVILPIELVVKS